MSQAPARHAKKDVPADLTFSAPFVVICVLYVTFLLLSNLSAGKMWAPFGSVTLPAAVMLFPVTYIFGDIFTEVYGYRRARLVIGVDGDGALRAVEEHEVPGLDA